MNEETTVTIYQGNPPAPGTLIETPYAEVIMSLEQAIAAWTAKSKSESAKTVKARGDTLTQFRAALWCKGYDLDSPISAVAAIAESWAASSVREGVKVAPATFNQRIAILSSFYHYAIAHEVLLGPNPMVKERIERRKVGAKDAARPIQAGQVGTGLAAIDRSTTEGLRDYALLSVALATGRRVSELAGLRYGHLEKVGTSCMVIWPRCKGNKPMKDTLAPKTTRVLYVYLQAVYGTQLLTLANDSPVWVSFSRQNSGQAIGTRTISNICERYLGTSKVHATRHTWAVNMHKQGASYQVIGKGLGHSNLKITSDYMEEQLGYENPYASALEDAFGI